MLSFYFPWISEFFRISNAFEGSFDPHSNYVERKQQKRNGKSEAKWFTIHSWPINRRNHKKNERRTTFGQWMCWTRTRNAISIERNYCCVLSVQINERTKYRQAFFWLLSFHFRCKKLATIWTPSFTFHGSFFRLFLKYTDNFWILFWLSLYNIDFFFRVDNKT